MDSDVPRGLDAAKLVGLTAEVVAAYVSKNAVAVAELGPLIAAVYASLCRPGRAQEPIRQKPTPPVPIRKTIGPDAIISLEDGKAYKTLRRHLSSRGLTPKQYREKWDLPADYPMTAAAYAAARSELALANGLGRSRTPTASRADVPAVKRDRSGSPKR